MCEKQCNLQLALADLGSELDVLLGSAGNLLGRHVVGCWVMTAGWVVVVVAGKEKGKPRRASLRFSRPRRGVGAKIFCGPAFSRRVSLRSAQGFIFSPQPPLLLFPRPHTLLAMPAVPT